MNRRVRFKVVDLTADCPITKALEDFFKEPVYVGTTVCYLGQTKKFISLPNNVRAFIKSFDKGDSVKPINFVLGTNNVLGI